MTNIYQCDTCLQFTINTQHICTGGCTIHKIANTDDRQRIAELEKQLAAMTAERDAAVGRCDVYAKSLLTCWSHKLRAYGASLYECVYCGNHANMPNDIEHRNDCIVKQARKELENE